MNLFPNWARNVIFLLIYILSGLALIIIIDGLATGTELTPFNTAIENIIIPLRHPLLTTAMVFITNIASPTMLFIATLILGIVLITHKDTYDTLLYIVSILFSIISFVVLKNIFAFPRPDQALLSFSGWSFPSGHATVSTAFFFATAYSFWSWPKTVMGKTILAISCILGGALVSFSRLYLGAHWALDVLAGVALGLLCVSFTLIIFNIFLEEKSWWRRRRRV